MAPHSSTLAWKIPWTEEPGGLQSIGSLRVGHDWATSLHFSLSWIGEGNGNPLQSSCLENSRDGGSWWAAIYGVTQSWTWLEWLSSSSSRWLSYNVYMYSSVGELLLVFNLDSAYLSVGASRVTQMVKYLSAMQETWVGSPGQEDPLEEGMSNHPSILAWRIPWIEEPGGLQSVG